MQAEEVELLALKGDDKLSLNLSTLMSDQDLVSLVDAWRDDLQILEEEETLAGIKANCTPSRDHLVSANWKLALLFISRVLLCLNIAIIRGENIHGKS